MSFEGNTTLKKIFCGTITRNTGGGVSTPLQLPRTGILARLHLLITGSVSGTLSAPNALGMASIVNRMRVTAQGGQDMFNLSGAGYHYLYRPFVDVGGDPTNSQSAYAAVTATSYNISAVLPFQVNRRDQVGLFMLQNEQTLVTVNLDWLADASVATGATVTGTAKVYAEVFTVPASAKDWPDLSFVHQVLEDQLTVSGSGIVTYEWPRGNIYLRMLHGLGFAQSGSDGWSTYQLKRNESDVISDFQDTALADSQYNLDHFGLARKAGTFYWSGIDESGLGAYGMARDTIDSRRLTNIKSFVNATGAGTLYSVRDTLLDLKQG